MLALDSNLCRIWWRHLSNKKKTFHTRTSFWSFSFYDPSQISRRYLFKWKGFPYKHLILIVQFVWHLSICYSGKIFAVLLNERYRGEKRTFANFQIDILKPKRELGKQANSISENNSQVPNFDRSKTSMSEKQKPP